MTRIATLTKFRMGQRFKHSSIMRPTMYEQLVSFAEKYGHQIQLPIGFESEWCGRRSLDLIKASLEAHEFDYFVGSIHHVGGLAIDYDQETYDRAKQNAGGSDEKLFVLYFDEQLEMLEALRPPVVGHIDLIRLKSNDFNLDWRHMPDVWAKILRNLDFVASYGGILEINTAALRKGMDEPYPKSEICQAFLERGGRFCLSDDSHGIAHIGTNYDRMLTFLNRNKITSLVYLVHSSQSNTEDSRFPTLSIETVAVQEIENHEVLSHV